MHKCSGFFHDNRLMFIALHLILVELKKLFIHSIYTRSVDPVNNETFTTQREQVLCLRNLFFRFLLFFGLPGVKIYGSLQEMLML